MYEFAYFGPQTGSSNNFTWFIDAISDSKVMFSRVADTNQYRSTVKAGRIYAKRNMADQKPEVVLTFFVF